MLKIISFDVNYYPTQVPALLQPNSSHRDSVLFKCSGPNGRSGKKLGVTDPVQRSALLAYDWEKIKFL
jgi:hypothetical protein